MNPGSPEKPSLRQRFREQAREEVLEAAERLFARDGLAEARIDAIAAEAGVSVGTVYNLYGDRAGLLQAVLDKGRDRFLELVSAYFEESRDAPFEARLRGVVQLLVGHMRDSWQMLRMLSANEVPEATACLGAVPRPTPSMIREMHARMTALMRHGIESGALGAVDVHVTTCALMGAIRTTIDVDLALGLDAPSEGRADAIVKLFLEGAARRP